MIPPAHMDSPKRNKIAIDGDGQKQRAPAAFAAAVSRASHIACEERSSAGFPLSGRSGLEWNRWVSGAIGIGALLSLLWLGALIVSPDRIVRALSPRQVVHNGVSPVAIEPAATTATPTGIPTRTSTTTSTYSPTDMPTSLPTPTPTMERDSLTPVYLPSRLLIPAIELDAPVTPVVWTLMLQGEDTEPVWDVASEAVGWHLNSATPGQRGNVVLAGHHNMDGMVFRDLYNLEVGDEVRLYAGPMTFSYRVREVLIVREEGASDAQREENARWIGAFPDERLTLISCWPPYDNTHRVIVVAKPRAGAQWIVPQEQR